MIAASDLRVGNWVYDGEHTQFPMFIVGIGEDYVYLDFYEREGDIWESTPNDLQGIPLTGELLEKLGFTFKDGLWRHEWGVKVKPEKGFVNIENKDKEHWLYGTCNCKDVWHLHQLQNVISVITKKELKVNIWK
jgi:hypothetical protein